jgi:chromosome segregation ATPase
VEAKCKIEELMSAFQQKAEYEQTIDCLRADLRQMADAKSELESQLVDSNDCQATLIESLQNEAEAHRFGLQKMRESNAHLTALYETLVSSYEWSTVEYFYNALSIVQCGDQQSALKAIEAVTMEREQLQSDLLTAKQTQTDYEARILVTMEVNDSLAAQVHGSAERISKLEAETGSMTKMNGDLRIALAAMQAQWNEMKSENGSLIQKITTLSYELGEARARRVKEKMDFEISLEKLKETNVSQEHQVLSLQEDLDTATASINALLKEKADRESDHHLEDFLQKNAEIASELSELQSEVDTIKVESSNLKKLLRSLESEKVKLLNEKSTSEGEHHHRNQQLCTELEILRLKVNGYSSDKIELEEKLRSLEAQFVVEKSSFEMNKDEVISKNKSLALELLSSREELEVLEASLNGSIAERNEIMRRLERMTSEAQMLTSQLNVFNIENATIKNENISLSANVQQLLDLQASLQAQLKEVQRESETQLQSIASLSNELTKETAMRSEEKKHYDISLATLIDCNESQEHQILALQKEVSSLRQQFHETTADVNKLASNNEAMQKEVTAKVEHIEILESSKATLLDEIEILSSKLIESTIESRTLRDKISSLDADNSALKNIQANCKQEMYDLNVVFERLQQSFSDLEILNMSLTTENAEIEAALCESRGKVLRTEFVLSQVSSELDNAKQLLSVEQDRNAELRDCNTNLEEKMEMATTTCGQQASSVAVMIEENEELKKRADRLAVEVEYHKTVMQEYSNQLTVSQEAASARMESITSQYDNLLEQLRGEHGRAVSKLDKAVAQKLHSDALLESATNIVSELRAENDMLKFQQQQMRHSMGQQQNRSHLLEQRADSHVNELLSKISRLQEEKDVISKYHEEFKLTIIAEIEALSSEKARLQEANDAITSQMNGDRQAMGSKIDSLSLEITKLQQLNDSIVQQNDDYRQSKESEMESIVNELIFVKLTLAEYDAVLTTTKRDLSNRQLGGSETALKRHRELRRTIGQQHAALQDLQQLVDTQRGQLMKEKSMLQVDKEAITREFDEYKQSKEQEVGRLVEELIFVKMMLAQYDQALTVSKRELHLSQKGAAK